MTWADVWETVQKHGVQTVLAGVVAWLVGRVRKEHTAGKAVRDATRALLADRVIQQYNYRMERGYCPIYALDSTEDMYNAYKALGGNGTIEDLYNRLRQLPREKKEGEGTL